MQHLLNGTDQVDHNAVHHGGKSAAARQDLCCATPTGMSHGGLQRQQHIPKALFASCNLGTILGYDCQ